MFVLSRSGPKVTLQGFQNHVAVYFTEGGKIGFEIESMEPGEWSLLPQAWSSGSEAATIVANANGHFAYRGHIPKAIDSPTGIVRPPTYLLAYEPERLESWCWDGESIRYEKRHATSGSSFRREWSPHWHPDTPVGNPLLVAPMDVVAREGILDIAAIDRKGMVGWSRFEASEGEQHVRSEQSFKTSDRFVAVCLTSERRLAAVSTKNELIWLRAPGGSQLIPFSPPMQLIVPSQAVFIAARPHSRSVAVIFADGSTLLVPVP